MAEEVSTNEAVSEKETAPSKEKVSTKEKGRVSLWWKGLKAEFRKIIWPDKETVAKQTAAVIIITVVLGAIISLLDTGVKALIDLII